jgi:hypothetical protein
LSPTSCRTGCISDLSINKLINKYSRWSRQSGG